MRRWLVLRAQGQTGRTARITPGWALGTHHEGTHLFASGDVGDVILMLLSSLLPLAVSWCRLCRGCRGRGCALVGGRFDDAIDDGRGGRSLTTRGKKKLPASNTRS